MTMAALLIIAMVLDALMGEPKWLWQHVPHPAVLMGRVVGWLDRTLNTGTGRKAKGIIALSLLIVLGYLIGQILTLFGPVVEIATAAVLLAQRSLVQHVQKVADGLRMSVQQGRRDVAMIVSRDTAAMDRSAVARSAIESAAENLSDGVIAPAFWFLIGGLPGLLIYKFVNTADSMIGYRTPRHEQFGWASARMDDLLNLVPARLTALLIALPAGAATQWQMIRSDAAQHRSPNAGWPEAAMARAIGVALAGPRTYNGITQEFAWVHSAGSRDIGPVEIDAAITRIWHAWAVTLGAAFLLCMLTS